MSDPDYNGDSRRTIGDPAAFTGSTGGDAPDEPSLVGDDADRCLACGGRGWVPRADVPLWTSIPLLLLCCGGLVFSVVYLGPGAFKRLMSPGIMAICGAAFLVIAIRARLNNSHGDICKSCRGWGTRNHGR